MACHRTTTGAAPENPRTYLQPTLAEIKEKQEFKDKKDQYKQMARSDLK